MTKYEELNTKRAGLVEEWNTLDGIAERTALEKERYMKIYEDIRAMDQDIEVEQRAVQMRADLAANISQRADQPKDDQKAAYERAFYRYISGNELTREERAIMRQGEERTNAQSTTVGKGGYTIPEGFSNMLEIAEKYYNPFTADQGFQVIRTGSGNDIPWPGTDDTGNEGYLLGEAVSAETSAVDVTFTLPITLKAYKYTSGMIRLSSEILQDSYFNFQQVIAGLLAERMGRAKATAFTTGAGATAPYGLDTKITATAALQVTPAANTAVTRTDLVNLLHSVDIAYRSKPSSKWMLNDGILKLIVLLTIGTNDDRPLWQPSIIGGIPSTIEGYPYIVNNKMDATAAQNNLTVIFGDMSKYIIREVADRRVLVTDQRYVEYDQTGLVMFERFDGQMIDAGQHPIKGLYMNKT